MLGSIPQQDVFQRVQSAKNENIAARSSILGGVLYFCFAFIPMFLAYSASLIDPKMVAANLGTDSQLILPDLITSLDYSALTFLVISSLAAALIGRLSSLWMTLLGGIAVGLAQSILSPYTSISTYRSAAPFVLAIVALLILSRHRVVSISRATG